MESQTPFQKFQKRYAPRDQKKDLQSGNLEGFYDRMLAVERAIGVDLRDMQVPTNRTSAERLLLLQSIRANKNNVPTWSELASHHNTLIPASMVQKAIDAIEQALSPTKMVLLRFS